MPGSTTSSLEVFPGWGADLRVWEQLHACFSYLPGENRATGYLYTAGEQDWPQPMGYAGPLLLERLRRLPGTDFPVVAFQAYRDGSGCGWHADTPFAAQAILSLGATRTFAVRRGNAGAAEELKVADGDLVFMPAGFQDDWQHCVPEEPGAAERCSLVFRTRAA